LHPSHSLLYRVVPKLVLLLLGGEHATRPRREPLHQRMLPPQPPDRCHRPLDRVMLPELLLLKLLLLLLLLRRVLAVHARNRTRCRRRAACRVGSGLSQLCLALG
jgi:hypothetical protein